MPEPQGTPPPKRRTAVKGHPGVYRRPIGHKRWRYEISYRDSGGVRRWQTTGDSLEQAQAALDEIIGKKRRNELVVPGRRAFGVVADEWLSRQNAIRPR